MRKIFQNEKISCFSGKFLFFLNDDLVENFKQRQIEK